MEPTRNFTDPITDEKWREIMDALTERGVNASCPACGKGALNTQKRYSITFLSNTNGVMC
jgi:hypothetical protein